MPDSPTSEGWAQPGNLSRRHYFRNGRAVCGMLRYGCSGPYDQHHDNYLNCGYCSILAERESSIPAVGAIHESPVQKTGVCDPCPRHAEDGSAGRHLIGRFR